MVKPLKPLGPPATPVEKFLEGRDREALTASTARAPVPGPLKAAIDALEQQVAGAAALQVQLLAESTGAEAPNRSVGQTAEEWKAKLSGLEKKRDDAVAILAENPGDPQAWKRLGEATDGYARSITRLGKETLSDAEVRVQLREALSLAGKHQTPETTAGLQSARTADESLSQELVDQRATFYEGREHLRPFVAAQVRYDPAGDATTRAQYARRDELRAIIAGRADDVAAYNTSADPNAGNGIQALLKEVGTLNRALRPLEDAKLDALLAGLPQLPQYYP